jgi:hypothetical protein
MDPPWLPQLALPIPWSLIIPWGWILLYFQVVRRIMILSQYLGPLILFILVCHTCLRTSHPLSHHLIWILVLCMGAWCLLVHIFWLVGVISLNQLLWWEVWILLPLDPIVASPFQDRVLKWAVLYLSHSIHLSFFCYVSSYEHFSHCGPPSVLWCFIWGESIL